MLSHQAAAMLQLASLRGFDPVAVGHCVRAARRRTASRRGCAMDESERTATADNQAGRHLATGAINDDWQGWVDESIDDLDLERE